MANNWTIISHIESPFMEEGSIIFEMQDSYWQLDADPYKIRDVVNMPSYIVSDWLWANRKPLDEKTIESHIIRKEAEAKYDSFVARPGSPTQILENLKSMKRDLLIGMVLRNDSEE
jgi:hypothetical protein